MNRIVFTVYGLFFIISLAAQSSPAIEIFCNERSKIPIVGNRLGINGFFMEDLDSDGNYEIVCTGNSSHNGVLDESQFVSVLELVNDGPAYDLTSQTDYVESVTALHVGDMSGARDFKVVTGYSDGLLQVFSYKEKQLISSFEVRLESSIRSIFIGDGDNDQQQELIVSTDDSLYFFTEAFEAEHVFRIVTDIFDVGDVDGDGSMEILGNRGVFKILGGEIVNQWVDPPFYDLNFLFLFDFNKDSINDIIYVRHGETYIYDASSHDLIESFEAPGSQLIGLYDINGDNVKEMFFQGIKAYDITVDSVVFDVRNASAALTNAYFVDLNDDGQLEMIVAGGYFTTAADFIYAYDLSRQLELWKTNFIDPLEVSPFAIIAVGDINQDNKKEILAFHREVTRKDTTQFFDTRSNVIYAYDSDNKSVVSVIPLYNDTSEVNISNPRVIYVDDLNGDGVNEILVGGSLLTIINSRTHEIVGTYAHPNGGVIRQLKTGDVDGDLEKEIVISTESISSNGSTRVLVLNASDLTLEWESQNYEGGGSSSEFRQLYVEDVDNDENLEIIVLSNRIFIFDLDESIFWISPDRGITTLAIANMDDDEQLELVYDRFGSGLGHHFNIMDGLTKEVIKTPKVFNSRQTLKGLVVQDLNQNGLNEFYFSSGKRLYLYENGVLLATKLLGNQLDVFDHLLITDYGNDQNDKVLLVGSDHALYEIDHTCYRCLEFKVSLNKVDPSCDREIIDGKIMSDVEGNMDSIIYAWSDGSELRDRDSLEQGLYFLTISNANGCRNIDSVELVRPHLSTEVKVLANTCRDSAQGEALIEVIEGVEPFSIIWSSGDTTTHAKGLVDGLYTVTTIDSNNCIRNDTVSISSLDLDLATSVLLYDCNGQSSGRAQVRSKNGVEPYSYHWSNGDTTMMANNLPAGQLTVQVKDSLGCTSRDTVDILPDTLEFEYTMDTICEDGDVKGRIQFNLIESNGTTVIAYNVIEDTLDLVIDSPGRKVFFSYNAYCHRLDTIDFQFNDLAVEYQIDEINDSAFVVMVEPIGGQGPYHIDWLSISSSGNNLLLGKGLYPILVSDVNGCQILDTLSLGLVTASYEVSSNHGLSVFPNPFCTSAEVTFDELDNISVYNALGVCVRKELFNTRKKSWRLDLSTEASGIYWVCGTKDGLRSCINVVHNSME